MTIKLQMEQALLTVERPVNTGKIWWARLDLNQRPLPCEGSYLPEKPLIIRHRLHAKESERTGRDTSSAHFQHTAKGVPTPFEVDDYIDVVPTQRRGKSGFAFISTYNLY